MPNNKKTSKKRPEQPQAAVETLDSIVSSTFEASLAYLRTQIQLVIDGKAAKTKHDPAYRVASLMRMVSQVAAEKRKADAAANKQLEKVTRQVVIAWLRAVTREERNSVIREALAMDQEGSILS
jgi:hypothetical protein